MKVNPIRQKKRTNEASRAGERNRVATMTAVIVKQTTGNTIEETTETITRTGRDKDGKEGEKQETGAGRETGTETETGRETGAERDREAEAKADAAAAETGDANSI